MREESGAMNDVCDDHLLFLCPLQLGYGTVLEQAVVGVPDQSEACNFTTLVRFPRDWNRQNDIHEY